MGPSTSDLDLAHRLADVASAIALRRFGKRSATHRKIDGTIASDADLMAEQAMCVLLLAERPCDAILSEERGSMGPISSRRWLLDPIDGTESFLAGGRAWGTHVALELEGELSLAVMTRPTEGARWWAMRGHGAWHTSAASKGRTSLVVAEGGAAAARVGGLVDPPSTLATKLAEHLEWIDDEVSPVVALLDGRVGAVLDEGGEVWDRAPALLLATEAGACCRGPAGVASPGDFWVLYAIPSLVDDMAMLLAEVEW